jgi:hypothetical protein
MLDNSVVRGRAAVRVRSVVGGGGCVPDQYSVIQDQYGFPIAEATAVQIIKTLLYKDLPSNNLSS